MSKLGYDVTGIDISPAMLQKAREKNKKANVRFVQGDMKNLEKSILKGERFDGAICLGIVSYHLLTDQALEAFLGGVHELLRKDGLFVFDARNAKKIDEGHLNKLIVHIIITERKLQLLLLNYNSRDLQNPYVIVWRPICLTNESGKVDFQIKEHKLRWFQLPTLKKLLTKNHFEQLAQYSGSTRVQFREDKHTTAWFVTRAK